MTSPPRPKSPPGYGKRRQHAKLLVLESEIGFLQEELKSLESVEPTSRCCKELDEFVATKPDPLIAIHQQSNESDHRLPRRMSGCCKSDCCCCSRVKCCPKCQGLQNCSCFNQNCCSFKSSCSNICFSKVNLCPSCVLSCCCCCCCHSSS